MMAKLQTKNPKCKTLNGGDNAPLGLLTGAAEPQTEFAESAPSPKPAVEFLEKFRPGGPWVLTAIVPDGKTETITASDASQVCAFVSQNDGKRNLYYSVNPTKSSMNSKAKKEDIARAEYLFADLDPRDDETPDAAKSRYLDELDAFELPATAVVDSGNGIQALWRLEAPVELDTPEKIADIEGRTKALILRLDGDASAHNIDRILRLPGTTNLPNKKKIKAGRVACPAKLISFNGATHPLAAFPPAVMNSKPGQDKQADIDVDTLPVSARIKKLIRGIDDPEHPYDSRSERVMAVLVAMAGAGCTDQQMAAVMRAESLPIGKHVREQHNPDQYLTRQIARARKVATDPNVARLNETYAVVPVGNQVAIMREGRSIEGRLELKFFSVSNFHTLLANRFVECGENHVPLARHWLTHPQRRAYEGLVFAPNRDVPEHYNLWRGFAVEPRPGDCSKFLTHLKDNVCRGDETLYLWLVGWFAQIVQHPDNKVGTSLVIRGKQGTGKTKVGQVFGSLLGDHYVPVSDPRYVTGRFNSHLMSCLLLHADEGFWAGDHRAEGKLKDLITGIYHHIEYKGKEPIRVRNYVRLLVTGNPDWLVPAGFEERRFAVLDIGEDHIQDRPYFKAIDDEMNNGGREALLDFLQHFDLNAVDVRAIPKTAALLDQKISSLPPDRSWWLDVLVRGELPWGCDCPRACPTQHLFDRYIRHAGRQGTRRRATETQIGIFLTKHVPGVCKTDGDYKVLTRTGIAVVSGTIYKFPPLNECRAAFAKMMQQDFDWGEPDDWTYAPPPDASDYDEL